MDNAKNQLAATTTFEINEECKAKLVNEKDSKMSIELI
jgi:hypothetical protein